MGHAQGARRDLGHANLAQFIEEGAVADLKPFGGLLAVPAVGLQDLEDDLALEVVGGLLGDVFEGDGFAKVDVGGDAATGGFGHHLGDEGFFAADQDIAAYEVLELADVSGPVIVLHQTDCTLREKFRCVMENFCIVLDEVVDEDWQVGDALPQGWEIDGHGIDAEEEVETESAVFDLAAEVSVGGRDQAGVDAAGFVAADADEGAVLQDLEELGLNAEVEAAHLVEEKGAHMGLLDTAQFGGHGTGKCTLFVAKEFGFEQGVRDGGTTYLDEGAARSIRESMQQADGYLLASAAFSLNKNRNVCLGDPFEFVTDSQHGGCFAEDNIQRWEIQ